MRKHLRQCARETSCLSAPGFKYYLRQTPSSASQEWQQWCELCQLFYTAASALRRLNGFVQNWNPALELSQTCRLLKTRKVVCVSLQLEEHRGSQGLPGLGQGCCWEQKQKPRQKARQKTTLSCISFKIPPRAFSSPLPSLSLPLPGCMNPAQPKWDILFNGVYSEKLHQVRSLGDDASYSFLMSKTLCQFLV